MSTIANLFHSDEVRTMAICSSAPTFPESSPTGPQRQTTPSDLLSAEETASMLGLSQQTLTNWRWKGCGPRWLKVGLRAVRYRRSDVEAFLAAGEKAV